MGKDGHGFFSKLTGSIPNTPPPLNKREQRDIADAHRGEPGTRGLSTGELIRYVRSQHKGVVDDYKRWGGGRVVVVKDPQDPSREVHHEYVADSRGGVRLVRSVGMGKGEML